MDPTLLHSSSRGLAAVLAGALALASTPARGGVNETFLALPWAPGGTQLQGGFAESVAPAGDVDGDGFGDVIAGATREDGLFVNEGGAYLFLGSAQGSSPTHAWLYRPGQVGAAAGFAVASAGDVNGDGFADVLVSVHQWDTPSDVNVGKVAVFHGGPGGLPLVPTYELSSPLPADEQRFGVALAPAGDVNGDGFADVLVGANFADGQFTQRGAAFVFHGGPAGLGPTPARTWFGPMAQNSGFGRYLSSAGDVNGDAFADVLVGAADAATPFPNGGATFLYLGSAGGALSNPDTVIVGSAADVQCGSAISLAGDVDGDGYGDVLIGFPGFNGGVGKVEVAFGGPGGLRSSSTVLDVLPGPDEYFGQYVATLGDLDGDGFADFGIGATDAATFRGRIVVFRGGREGIDIVGQLFSPGTDGSFGENFITSGDTDGDGRAEILASGQGMSVIPGQREGRAFQFRAPRLGLRLPGVWPRVGTQPGTGYGTAVAIVPRFTSAFPPRLVIGDPGFNGCGRISVHNFSATAGVELNELSSITSSIPMQGLGTRLVDAGDMNRDGFSDFASSSPTFESGGLPEVGRVDFHAGAATGLPAPPPSLVVLGARILDHLGSALAGRGDVNGDGFHDLLIGARQWDEPGLPDCGKAFLFFGGASGPVTASPWTVTGTVAAQGLGAGVALTDLDADGYTDVVIGSSSPTFDSNLSGKVQVHYGGPSGPSNAFGLRLDPREPSVSFGQTVAAIGDVTADGIADLAVGAPAEDNHGVVRLYEGTLGRSQSSIPIARLAGTQDDERYGEAIAGGGDVDGDGIGDFAIGHPGWDGAANDEGRVTLHFGAPFVPEIPATFELFRGFADARFGSSIAPFRDLNADGFADMVVGAPGSDRVYPFFGDGAFGMIAHLQVYELGPLHRYHPARTSDPGRLDLGFHVQNAGSGRARVKFELEIVPHNQRFSGTPTTTSGGSFDSEVGFVAPTVFLTPSLPGRGLKVRGRWTTRSPFFPRTRWITPEAHTSGDHDLWITGTAVGVPSPGAGGPAARTLRIEAVSPNPSAGHGAASRVAFFLPGNGRVTVDVFDLRGARVLRLLDEVRAAGPSSVVWDGRDDEGRAVPSGVYFVVLRAADADARAKMVRLP